jgi:hypothetical protein
MGNFLGQTALQGPKVKNPPLDAHHAPSFPGELQKLTCKQSPILIDGHAVSLPLTSLSLL